MKIQITKKIITSVNNVWKTLEVGEAIDLPDETTETIPKDCYTIDENDTKTSSKSNSKSDSQANEANTKEEIKSKK